MRARRTAARRCGFGRTTYDASLPYWGPNGPTGEARVPVFVVTDRGRHGLLGERHRGGAALLQAGRIDEICVDLVPVLFGSGTRLYDEVGGGHIELELVEVIPTPNATHLRPQQGWNATQGTAEHPPDPGRFTPYVVGGIKASPVGAEAASGNTLGTPWAELTQSNRSRHDRRRQRACTRSSGSPQAIGASR